MTSSLVGSEMCIRDSPHRDIRRRSVRLVGSHEQDARDRVRPRTSSPFTVSYTHLTLPTICSV
eukprot:8395362-Prorocentrum_lima.AAC.1